MSELIYVLTVLVISEFLQYSTNDNKFNKKYIYHSHTDFFFAIGCRVFIIKHVQIYVYTMVCFGYIFVEITHIG